MTNIEIVIKPLITEKSTHQQTTRNAYAFKVHENANKHQIKLAVEQMYEVKVVDVRTMTRKGKPRRTKTGFVNKSSWKRAVVVLAEDSKIDLF